MLPSIHFRSKVVKKLPVAVFIRCTQKTDTLAILNMENAIGERRFYLLHCIVGKFDNRKKFPLKIYPEKFPPKKPPREKAPWKRAPRRSMQRGSRGDPSG